MIRLYLAVAAVLAALSIVGAFYLFARHQGAAAERPKTEAARDDAAARSLEAQGERQGAARVDAYVHVSGQAQAATATLQQAAGAAPDANQPLPSDRALRLRANDLSLCQLSPDICAPAAADPAGRRSAVQPGGPPA